MSQKKLIIALDFASLDDVKNIVKDIDPDQSMVKVGLQLYVSEGKKVLDYLSEKGFEIFLDLKLHDIPNTVRKTIKEISNFNVSMTTIHLQGGRDMIEASLENSLGTKIIGVSILTSLNDTDINEIYGSHFNDQFNAYGLALYFQREDLPSISASIEQKEGSIGGITNNWILGLQKEINQVTFGLATGTYNNDENKALVEFSKVGLLKRLNISNFSTDNKQQNLEKNIFI